MTNKLKVFVGVPAYGGQISAQQARMWMELGNTLGGSSERFELVGMMHADINGIDRARNYLLAAAFQTGADWLLMIDADTWVEGLDDSDAGFQLCRMISDGDRAGATIVGAPVAKRDHTKAHEVMVYTVFDEAAWAEGDPNALEPISVEELGRGLKAVHAIATAVFAVKITAIGETVFTLPPMLGMLGEDLDFCRKIDKAEGKIMVDTRVNTRHLSRSVPVGPLKPTT